MTMMISKAVRSLVAASSPMQPPTAGSQVRPPGVSNYADESIRSRADKWQLRILKFAESVPEVAGAAALVRGTVKQLALKIVGGNEADRRAPQAWLDGFDLERAAELLWLSGEFFVGVPADKSEAGYTLSLAEFESNADQAKAKRKNANGVLEPMPDPWFRVWRPSKSNRWHGTSPNEAAMDLLEAMYLHQLADTAVAKSRLAGAGVVFWPTNAPDHPVAVGEAPMPGSRQAMLAEFNRAAITAINDQSSHEAHVPFVVFFDPGPSGDVYKPEMFRIERDDHAANYAERFTTYRDRYAQCIELPAESTQGMGSTNHWSAWQIDVDKGKTYVVPLVEDIVRDLQRRVIQDIFGTQFTVEIDDSKLIKKPDLTDVIIKLMQLEQVTPESGLKALKSGDLEDLVYQNPPQKSYTSNVAPGQPSDFGNGNTDRGGGKFREQA